ncbi:MAG: flagellar biosynthetic protein FliO [Acidobacteriota bacterium]|nr:flagellar biosynthetic protein FliO [Acidobacteriota bacterium]
MSATNLTTTAAKSNEGLGAWLAAWLRLGGWRMARPAAKKTPRLSIVERIPLAPRHQLALVEADGQRLLVALNQEGTPAFYPLAAAKHKTVATAAARRVTQC